MFFFPLFPFPIIISQLPVSQKKIQDEEASQTRKTAKTLASVKAAAAEAAAAATVKLAASSDKPKKKRKEKGTESGAMNKYLKAK